MITKILQILVAVLEFFEERKRAKKAQQKQADYDAINEDPGAWFNDHFGGVHDSADMPRDADEASKAKDKS